MQYEIYWDGLVGPPLKAIKGIEVVEAGSVKDALNLLRSVVMIKLSSFKSPYAVQGILLKKGQYSQSDLPDVYNFMDSVNAEGGLINPPARSVDRVDIYRDNTSGVCYGVPVGRAL